jgi:hypothetical protein
LNRIGGRYIDGRQVTPSHPIDHIGTFDVTLEATGMITHRHSYTDFDGSFQQHGVDEIKVVLEWAA